MPDVGEGVAEAEIVAWHVKPGDPVKEDQSLVDVMTDKATVDMTSPVDGTITRINGVIGEMVPVGAVLLEIETQTEFEDASKSRVASSREQDRDRKPSIAPTADPAPPRMEKNGSRQVTTDPPIWPGRLEDEGPLAAPATRRRAYELGIPLYFVPGTGPGGRITPDDLDAFIHRDQSVGPVLPRLRPRTEIDSEQIIGMRRRIAEKMQDAKRRIPHFGYVEELDLTELEKLRGEMNAERRGEQTKLTLLPFFMRAIAQLQQEFPQVNAVYDDDAGIVHRHRGVHIGIATQTRVGLLVPVVRHVEARDIWDCAAELGRVTQAARDGSAGREMLSGSTITLTSLGALGGISATPVINSPEVAIIAPNKLERRPVVVGDQIVIRTMMNLSTAFDHRIVDGHDAASFVKRLKRLLESPAILFLGQL